MTTGQLTDFIVEEVEELMTAGRVGLYEFLEVLQADYSTVPAREKEASATAALSQLLDSGDAVLEWRLWSDVHFAKRASRSDITAKEWKTPTEAPYLAIVPIADALPTSSADR